MKRVLIIEDNSDNMELIRFIMESNGYATICATTGSEGVELAVKERPDFVILDIQLPDIDGYEVLKRIRASESDGDMPVIAMTSYAMVGDRKRMLDTGCNGYIEKPIDPETVVQEIKKALKEK